MGLKYRLRELRCKYQLSQGSLAAQIGVTRGAVAQWENGITFPSSDALEKLADYFNISIDYLMGRTDTSRLITSANENDLISISPKLNDFKNLNDQQKEVICILIKTFKEQNSKK